MKLTYPGPFDEVEVDAVNLVARRGEPVNVEDADIAESLIRQGWKKPGKKKESD